MFTRDNVPLNRDGDRRLDFANLVGIDAQGADLSNCHFYHSDLRSANFRGANLEHINLNSADVSGADFTDTKHSDNWYCGMVAVRAVFYRAHLANVTFDLGFYEKSEIKAARRQGIELFRPRTDLTGASFVGANLTGAKFLAVNLTGADFTGARTDGIFFGAGDGLESIMTDVKGLEETRFNPATTDESGSSPPTRSSGASLEDKLLELDKLLASGLINNEEHAAARRHALGL
jgi:uncharacterized protein YjbI with pentapeptide repeats